MRTIRLISRLILGVVFIFSGFVEAVDPLGSAYKFSDYFTAFGIGFLEFVALPLGIALSAFELVLGISLLLGYRRRVVFRALFWFMAFFTLLTLVLAIFNPVSDCGCFGDALILTNWQTFLKNLVLMLFVLILFFSAPSAPESGKPVREWMVILGFAGLAAGFSIWNYRHLPLLDFRAYDVGTVITEEMQIPEGAPVDQYETTLIYKNKGTGETAEFSIDDYPRDTALWEFVTSESVLVSKGYEPPIQDFALSGAGGTDQAQMILADPGYSLLMLAHDLGEADMRALQNAREWSQLERLADTYSFYAVTSSTSGEVDRTIREMDLGYEFLMADEILLKTMVRSNPGFLLIKNGIIIGKWGFRDFPAIGEIDPEWPELIGNAAAPVDEEAQMLMEAGVYENFSFNVVDFERFVPELVFEPTQRLKERLTVYLWVAGLILLLILAGRISAIRI